MISPAAQPFDGVGLFGRVDGGHEKLPGFGVDDGIGDLIGLCGDKPAPDRVALWPDILAFVLEPLAPVVHHDGEGHTVEPRDDAAVEFRRAPVDAAGGYRGQGTAEGGLV